MDGGNVTQKYITNNVEELERILSSQKDRNYTAIILLNKLYLCTELLFIEHPSGYNQIIRTWSDYLFHRSFLMKYIP